MLAIFLEFISLYRQGRNKDLGPNEFSNAFFDADELILMDIYAAREKDTGLVSSNELGDAIRTNNVKCTNVHSHHEAASYLKEHAKPGDIILTVGAGDVVKVGEEFLA